MNTTHYPSRIRALLADERLPSLGHGRPNAAVRGELAGLTVAQLFEPLVVTDADAAKAGLSGLWLYHDFLDESHTLSQEIETPSGSFWHGIMHRREGDFGNSGYWFRRVGRHPVFESLTEAAHAVDASAPMPWDPFWFIEKVQSVVRKSEAEQQGARLLQQVEWHCLFEYCFQEATR
jgi:hypothetical protein